MQNPLRYIDPKGLENGDVWNQHDLENWNTGDNSVYPPGHNDGTNPPGKFEYHGNWCGPFWTGGTIGTYSPLRKDEYASPVDGLDSACKVHDVCYASCRKDNPCDSSARGQCMTTCDRNLASGAAASGHQYSSPLYLWMQNNNKPDAGSNDSSCDCKK